MALYLNPEKARLFRIVHIQNVPWILEHGLCCRNSPNQNPNYVEIGHPELIGKRAAKVVPIEPGGTFSDYVPFYFTPCSIMMLNIHTGYNVKKRDNRDIVIFVTSIHRLVELEIPFVFTNQHAYAAGTEFYNTPDKLNEIDWPLLRSRNFKTDDEDPGKQVRYQAEAMVHRRVPRKALLGIACYDDAVREKLESQVASAGRNLTVKTIPTWYF